LAPINRALFDWAETYDWNALKKVHNGLISTASANASYALPADFRKLDGHPMIAADGSNVFEFTAIDPSRRNDYSATDYWVLVLGNQRDTQTMYINSPVLVSGASVSFTYYASPVSLATGGSVTECPDPSYIVQRSLYYLYKAREDGRFPEAKVESERILARMIENETSLGLAYADRQVSNWLATRHHFRIGRD
jgi:hypothetical protein